MLCLVVLCHFVGFLHAFQMDTQGSTLHTYSPLKVSKKHEQKELYQSNELTELRKNNNEGKKVLMSPLHFAYSDQWPKRNKKGEKGSGGAHLREQENMEAMKQRKNSKSYNRYAKGQKGLHDKETHNNKYMNKKGTKGQKSEKRGHYDLHRHFEKGRKNAKFGETGVHRKGHHTKGEHNVHKKDEYHKIQEFYDEHHEGGEHENKGNFHELRTGKNFAKSKKEQQKLGGRKKKEGKKGQQRKGIGMEEYHDRKLVRKHSEDFEDDILLKHYNDEAYLK